MSERTATVGPDDDGIRLDRWFKRHEPGLSHTMLSMWARKGLVRLDGARADGATRLEAGQRLSFPALDAARASPVRARVRKPLSEADAAFAQSLVIWRDANAIVLDKPPGLATQGGTATTRHVDGLLDALWFEREDRPKLVHRLDKDTSGVLLLARHARAAAWFSKIFASRDARKFYWALVLGDPPDEGTIVAPLAKQPGTGGEKMHVDEANGLPAKTRFRVVDRIGTRAAWLELEPLTGRTHQLRVHCATIGHPIVGDLKYGGREAVLTGGVSRKMHLHARRLIVANLGGGKIDVSADLPEHMAASFEMLGLDVAAAKGRPEWRPIDELKEEAQTKRVPKGLPGSARPKPKPKAKPFTGEKPKPRRGAGRVQASRKPGGGKRPPR